MIEHQSVQKPHALHKLYNVGLYIRLSQESKNQHRGEESSSIENQISMLSKFVDMMPGWIETRTYIEM